MVPSGFNLHFPNAEHLLTCSFATCSSSLVNFLFISKKLVVCWVGSFLLVCFRVLRALFYILDTSPLSGSCFAGIFYKSTACLIFIIVSLEEQEFFILILFNLPIFSFMLSLFVCLGPRI